MNPPLRTQDDVNALREGIVDGTIDAIASDHAPHHTNLKMLEFDKAPLASPDLRAQSVWQ
jgi:dihydroorotase